MQINNDMDENLEKEIAELKEKMIPVIKGGGSYILHSDHSEPPEVEFETMQYFFGKAREIAKRCQEIA